MDAPIRIEGVSKRFRLQAESVGSIKEAITQRLRPTREEFWALRDVNLEIPKGSMFALIGHNGSGKSTLLRCVSGIYKPTEGRIHTHGRISALLELGAGFHPDLTGRENIQLNAAILGLRNDEIAESYDDIVDFAGVREFIDVPIKHYSSGMKVRLGFAVAVHLKPEILIIDEVIAVGDEEFQRRCFDFLYELRNQGVTIVVVSHSLELIRSLCDEAAWLEHGEVMASGPVNDVVKAYVSRVNDLEVGRGDGTVDLDDVPGRSGSGEVRITGVELLDGLGVSEAQAIHGDPTTIRLHYLATEAVQDPLFGLTLYHENGTFVTGTSTHLVGLRTGRLEGRGHVDYHLESMGLTPGRYQIGIAIQDRHAQHHFDLVERMGSFAVRLSTGTAARGLVDLAGTWSVSGGAPVAANRDGADEDAANGDVAEMDPSEDQ